MGEIIISDQLELPCSSRDAFDLIAMHGLPPWRLPLGTDLRVGVPISVPITLPASLGGQHADVLGRVVRVERPHLLVIAHELPWRGTITVKVRPVGGDSCRLRLVSSVDEDLVTWATRLFMPPSVQKDSAETWRIGLLSSGSGPAGVFSMATKNMATLAVEELNQDGGVLGRNIELTHGDDASHPGLGAAELVRLKASGCDVVLANVMSATFRKLLPVARRHNILLVHTLMNEGDATGEESFQLGERPMAQASAAIPALMRATGGDRFYLAGSDYCWPRVMMRSARAVIERAGGSVSGEHYLPLGSNDFTSLIESIDRHGTELVVSTFVGADEVAFEQQMHMAGVGERVRTVSFTLDESTHEYIGPAASAGLWTVFSYFQALDSAENIAFLAHYRARFGADAPPVSSLTECVYEAVHLVARAAMAAGETSPSALGRQLRDGVAFTGPRGRVEATASGIRQPIYVAHSSSGQLEAVDQRSTLLG
ncbi:substrate-binding protein [Nocardioides sp. NPDC006303]|uniref:substrate-binding protein n=1 Tax=Nocardioides sp. NPDC006303 TaxID=3156747 RepID=UPI00339E8667